MASASNTAAFIIIHRGKNGEPDRILSYNEEEATYLLVALNIIRGLLNLEQSEEGFAEMAKTLRRNYPHGWYEFFENTDLAKEFIQLVLDTFPWMYLDDGFDNPNVTACHYRRDHEKSFVGSQAICLNGPRTRDMCAAAKKAKESNNPKSKESQQYRKFIFLFAITLFHELGHVFITFLTRREHETPEEMKPDLHGIHELKDPEAGASLEALVFGGAVIHACDDAYDESQPGAPHLVNAKEAGQLSQETIDEFVQCKFKFPFKTSGAQISEPLKPIGDNSKIIPFSDPMDPVAWPLTRKLVKAHISNPFNFAELEKLEPSVSTQQKLKIQVGPKSALAQKVLQPNLAIKVVE